MTIPNWSAIPKSSLAGRILRAPLALLPEGKELKVRRGPAKGLRWKVGSSTHGCWLGTYELEKRRALERLVSPGDVVYDIGAQAGYYTLCFSRLVGDTGHVVAMEPFPQNLVHILHHIQVNDVSNVSVVAAGADEASRTAGMTTGRGASQNTIVENAANQMRIATVSVDSLVVEDGFPPPDFVKIDIEGAEGRALRGMSRVLEEHRPVLSIALHGPAVSQECTGLLAKQDYTIQDLEGRYLDDPAQTDEIIAEPA